MSWEDVFQKIDRMVVEARWQTHQHAQRALAELDSSYRRRVREHNEEMGRGPVVRISSGFPFIVRRYTVPKGVEKVIIEAHGGGGGGGHSASLGPGSAGGGGGYPTPADPIDIFTRLDYEESHDA